MPKFVEDHRGVVHLESSQNPIRMWKGTACVASIQSTWRPASGPVTCQWCLAMVARWGRA